MSDSKPRCWCFRTYCLGLRCPCARFAHGSRKQIVQMAICLRASIGVPRERQKARASKTFAHTYVRTLRLNHTVMHICIHACLCVYAQGSWRNQLAQASRARTRARNARKQARARDWRNMNCEEMTFPTALNLKTSNPQAPAMKSCVAFLNYMYLHKHTHSTLTHSRTYMSHAC